MRRLVPITSVEQIGMLADGLVPTLPAEKFASHAPDVHLAAMEHGIVAGRLSVWWNHGPTLDGQKVGAIGHYLVADDAAAQQLLEEAIRLLRENGITRVLAPINGSPWRTLGCVTESSTHPPFFLEPREPLDCSRHFTAAGFAPVLHWHSCQQPLPCSCPPSSQNPGDVSFTIRPVVLSLFDAELEAIYTLASHEQRNELVQGAMTRQAFVARHRRSRAITQPDLCLFAEEDQKLVGYVFAVPDLRQEERGEPVDTLVVRNLTTTGHKKECIRRQLLEDLFCRARKRGFSKVIHAFVPDTAACSQHGEVIRRYGLYARSL